MNRFSRNRERKESEKQHLLSHHDYNVTRKDLVRAYTLYCKGYTEEAIAGQLGITMDCFIFYRVRFRTYFEKRETVDFKVIPLERNKDGNFTGKTKKDCYKINPFTIDLNFVHDMTLAGFSQEKIASMLGVNPLTFIRYKRTNSAIQHTIDSARARKDLDVLLALHSAATGYEYKKTYLTQFDGDIITKDYTELKHPNIHAAINWLINSSNIDWSGIERGSLNTDKGSILQFLDKQNLITERTDVNAIFKKTTED